MDVSKALADVSVRVVRGKAIPPLIYRFWGKVQVRGESECWSWTGARDAGGYGRIQVFSGKNILATASRVSYEIHNGPIPASQVVRHACDNPACVNPRHLVAGTHGDNMRDMRERGRSLTGDGHPSAKLSNGDVRWLLFSIAYAGCTQRFAAKNFSVSEALVSRILSGSVRAQLKQQTQDVAQPTAAVTDTRRGLTLVEGG